MKPVLRILAFAALLLAPALAGAQAPAAGPVAAGAAMAQVQPSGSVTVIAAPKAAHPIDVTPVTDELIQVFMATLSAVAIRAAFAILSYFNLQNQALLRQVVDQGLQKSIGAATEKIRQRVAESHGVSIDVKNEFLQHAGQFAIDHIPDALAKFGIKTDSAGNLDPASVAKLQDMVQARAGMIAIDMAKARGESDPIASVLANAAQGAPSTVDPNVSGAPTAPPPPQAVFVPSVAPEQGSGA
jgi:hypothetical protein